MSPFQQHPSNAMTHVDSGLPAVEVKVVGHSPAFLHLLRMLDRVAPTDRAVLISGPTGAGKEVLAQRIHRRGRHPGAPFLDINCGALPEHLVEAELFGHAKGAFTGAVANHPGHFERVGRGTLFLDEIGELPLNLQPKLLRVLETRSFRPLGSTEVKRFEGRVVAASHRDLDAWVREGRFREDLYYRLAVFILEVPGLDQRREDIPELVTHFASLQPRALTFSDAALIRLQGHPWPGNIRQLRNNIERLLILATGDPNEPITADMLPQEVATSNSPSSSLGAERTIALPLREAREVFEREYLAAQIMRFGGNISRTAAFIGMERSALHRKLKSLGVSPARGGDEDEAD